MNFLSIQQAYPWKETTMKTRSQDLFNYLYQYSTTKLAWKKQRTTTRRFRSLQIGLALICILFVSGLAHGQGLGSIVGTLTDPSVAVMPSAKVTATGIGTVVSSTAMTASRWNYA